MQVALTQNLTQVFSPAVQDIIEGGSLRIPLQELHQMILTPIKAYSSPSATPEARCREPPAQHQPSLMGPESQSPDCKDNTVAASASASASAGASGGLQPHQLSSCDGELAVAPLPEGDLPGQFTRVMGKGILSDTTKQSQELLGAPWVLGKLSVQADDGSSVFQIGNCGSGSCCEPCRPGDPVLALPLEPWGGGR